MGRASVVGITAGDGPDGTGIEFRSARDFLHLFTMDLAPKHPPVKWVLGLFLGLKRPEDDADNPPTSSAEVKERLELYLYFYSGTSYLLFG